MHAGAGCSGFIAFRDDDPVFAQECPLELYTLLETETPGEWQVAEALAERTSYGARDQGKDWVGTASGLWTIAAAVYMTVMGPQGFREVGETCIARSHYAAKRLAELPGVTVKLSPAFFKEFVVCFDGTGKTVAEVNQQAARPRRLRRQGPLGRVPRARAERPVLRHRVPQRGRHRGARDRPQGGAAMSAHVTDDVAAKLERLGRLRRDGGALRDYHAPRWNEPLIMEQSVPGERGVLVPQPEAEVSGRGRRPAAVRAGRDAPRGGARPARDLPAPGPASLPAPVADDARHGPRLRHLRGHVHDEVQPQDARGARALPQARRAAPLAGRGLAAGPAADRLRLRRVPEGDLGHGRHHPAAGRRLARRLHQRLRHARVLPRARRARPAHRDDHHDLLAPVRRGDAGGGRLQGHHRHARRERLPRPRGLQGGRVASARSAA